MKVKIVLGIFVFVFYLLGMSFADQEELISSSGSTNYKNTNDIEYIAVGKLEKGFKVYFEFGGGVLVNGGLIWRMNPIFGIGGGIGYTMQPYVDYGVSLSLKAETIPVWFDIDFAKLNVVVGLNGVFFFGSGTQYVGAVVGCEGVFKRFQYIVPLVNIYLYLSGESIIPKFSFQLRYSF